MGRINPAAFARSGMNSGDPEFVGRLFRFYGAREFSTSPRRISHQMNHIELRHMALLLRLSRDSNLGSPRRRSWRQRFTSRARAGAFAAGRGPSRQCGRACAGGGPSKLARRKYRHLALASTGARRDARCIAGRYLDRELEFDTSGTSIHQMIRSFAATCFASESRHRNGI